MVGRSQTRSITLVMIVSILAAVAAAGGQLRRATPVKAAKTSPMALQTQTAVSRTAASARPDFDDKTQCEVAYDSLVEKCNRGVPGGTHGVPGGTHGAGSKFGTYHGVAGGPKAGPGGSTWSSPDRDDRLMDDAEGIAGGPTTGESAYAPPEGWDYRSHGDDWEKQFPLCGNQDQSPVDLSTYIDVRGQTKYLLWFDYHQDPKLKKSSAARLVNDGHSLRYDVKENKIDLGYVKIQDQEFKATEYQFKAPSEHSLDGAVFPLELQIYNKPDEGKVGPTVALAIFFREGPSNPFIAALMKSMHGDAPKWSYEGLAEGPIHGEFFDAFDLESVIPKVTVTKEASFYNYQGSLTQPPCTAGVDWWVLSTANTASREEIRFIRKAIFGSPSMRHGNTRATMPLGNRTVFVGLTGFQHDLVNLHGFSSQDTPWGDHISTPGLHGPAPAPAGSPAASPGPAPVAAAAAI